MMANRLVRNRAAAALSVSYVSKVLSHGSDGARPRRCRNAVMCAELAVCMARIQTQVTADDATIEELRALAVKTIGLGEHWA